MPFIKSLFEYFLFFVDRLDSYIGRGGGYSNYLDWIWAAKTLSDLLKDLGGSQGHF